MIDELIRILPISEHDLADPLRIARKSRQLIADALQEIGTVSPRNRMIVRTIQLVYIERIGSNELVANRLHLSLSTLYRYLRSGIEQLAIYLINSCSNHRVPTTSEYIPYLQPHRTRPNDFRP